VPAGLGLEPGATHGNAETEAVEDDREDVHARARGLVYGRPGGTHQPPAGLRSEPPAARASVEVEVAGDDREDVHVHARARRVVNGRPAGALIVVKTKGLLLVLVMSAGPYVHMRGNGNGSVQTKMG
jgi:hypothetical protein